MFNLTNIKYRKILVSAVLIFFFAFSLRLWNLNTVGRWSDEAALVEKGYTLTELIRNKNFNSSFWYQSAFDHPPLSMYFYGLVSYKDFIGHNKKELPSFSQFWKEKGTPVFKYDLTYPRLVSAIISSLAVTLIFLFGLRYFSFFIGVGSSIIFAMLPHFLGYSQLVTYESWVALFFTASVFLYFLYLEKKTTMILILTGIVTGLTIGVKESTIIIFGFYVGLYFIWKNISKNKKVNFWHIPLIAFIAFITFVLICPMPWLHSSEYLNNIYNLWFKNQGLIPEVQFGRRMGARSFYYPLALLITTPAVILFLTLIGLKSAFDKRRKWIYAGLIVWFLSPFLMMFFHHRQHMVRYIIEIYAPLSLLSALGIELLAKKISKKLLVKILILGSVALYLVAILVKATPYYLEYYNELVGGTKNVYKNKLFLIGWFGEGLKDPGIYIAENAIKGSNIGLATDPYSLSAVYRVPTLKYELYNPQKKYDYVMVNYYKVIRLEFDERSLLNDYILVYTEKAGDIDFVHIYKRK